MKISLRRWGPRCAISSEKKIASEPRFLLRRKWVKMVLAAEFPAIPSSTVKIASKRRCAILVRSASKTPKKTPKSEDAMGGWKKRGEENLTNDTPPKKGFWTPPRTVRFPPPSGVSALFFLYKNPRQRRPEALLEGSKNFRESAFSGTFSSPHTVLHPPISRPNKGHFLRLSGSFRPRGHRDSCKRVLRSQR